MGSRRWLGLGLASAVAVPLLGLTFLEIPSTVASRRDAAAWAALLAYAASEGPQAEGERSVEPPCDPADPAEEDDTGDGYITLTARSDDYASLARPAEEAAQRLSEDGWPRAQGTAGTRTYLAGERTLHGREVFAAVETFSG